MSPTLSAVQIGDKAMCGTHFHTTEEDSSSKLREQTVMLGSLSIFSQGKDAEKEEHLLAVWGRQFCFYCIAFISVMFLWKIMEIV